MKIPTVRSVCCFDVRFGSLVIACLELAYAVVGLIDGLRLAYLSVSTPTAGVATSTVSPADVDGGSGSGSEYTFVLRDKSFMRKLSRMYFWFHLAETVGVLIIASLLVHGIRTRRRSLFMPWLGIHFLTTVIFGVLVFVVPLGAVAEFGSNMAGPGVTAAVGCLCAFIINGYLTIVVYSHYREIGLEKARAIANRPVEVVCVRPDFTAAAVLDQQPPSYDEIVKNKDDFLPKA